MPFGFPPAHQKLVALPLHDPALVLCLLVETAEQLGWEIKAVSEVGIHALAGSGFLKPRFDIHIRLGSAQLVLKSESTGSAVYDWGKNEQNLVRFLEKMQEVQRSRPLEHWQERYKTLEHLLVSPEEMAEWHGAQTAREQLQSISGLLVPNRNLFFTPLLFWANVLVFGWMVLSGVSVFSPDSDSLLRWGALFRPPIQENGEWWRLSTSNFVHIGLFHLALNMLALLNIGSVLEPLLGKARFLLAYLLAGICGSLCSLWWHENSLSAGASGAVFGMTGMYLALLFSNLFDTEMRKSLLPGVLVFVGYNLLYGLKGEIDNAGHIGGLLGGLVMGFFVVPSLKSPGEKVFTYSIMGIWVVMVFLAGWMVRQSLPTEMKAWAEKMTKFEEFESMALEVYSRNAEVTREDLANELQNRGLYYWVKCKELSEEAQKMSITSEALRKSRLLETYCNLRMESYQKMLDMLARGNFPQPDTMAPYNQRIKEVIDQIKKGEGE
jgi:rhomboid protease GluP